MNPDRTVMKIETNKSEGLFLGADGCRNGWIAAVLDHGTLRLERYESVSSLTETYPAFDAFLIDMAIGLRDSAEEIRPDDAARKELGKRASTIFSIPCRKAVYADDEAAQKEANIRAFGKSLAKQTMMIIPKIRELDEFLNTHPEYKNRILESHPELDFGRLNGEILMSHKKKPEGIAEREQILKHCLPGIPMPDWIAKARELNCNIDDLLDAVCLAVTGKLMKQGYCETLPEDPQKDACGLYMRLTVPQKGIMKRMAQKKVAVVTGGAHGIGKCIADSFRSQGMNVYVIDKAEGDHYVGDISKKAVLEKFVKHVIEKEGGIDVLVNNALPLMKGIDECSYEEFQYALSVGVTAPFYLAKLFAPYFRPGASIVNISSSRDRMSQPQTESYTAAKGGIAALTHALAVSFAGKVRVNSISPGWIDTTGTEYEGPDALQQLSGRVGKPQDIADMVLYLCSDKAGFISGENICIDGGMTKLMIYHGDHGWSYDPE